MTDKALRYPSVFVSHGTPMLALADDDYTQALRRYFSQLPKPKAVVVLSAHWQSSTGVVEINVSRNPQIAYDFRGFPGELYQISYPCPGSPETAVRVASLLADAGLRTELTEQAMDHGAWVPLRLAYPDASVPVVQISLPYPTEPRWILKMGKALAPLRGEGILLLASGGAVHNLEKLVWHQKSGASEIWATKFEAWVKDQLRMKDVESLLNYEFLAPQTELAHPTAEHFFPIFFAIGAAWPGDSAHTIFEGVQYGSLSMYSFALS